MDVLLLFVKALPKNPCQASLLLILKMIWCNANLSLLEPQNLFLADHVVMVSTKPLSSVSALSLESCLFYFQTLLSLWIFIRLDLMLLLSKTKSHGCLQVDSLA